MGGLSEGTYLRCHIAFTEPGTPGGQDEVNVTGTTPCLDNATDLFLVVWNDI